MVAAKRDITNVINKIELELLSTLLDYAVPFIDKKTKPKQKVEQKPSNLEHIANSKPKPKIGIKDINELESLLLKNLSDNVKVNKNIGIGKDDIIYSLNIRRQKNKGEKDIKYSILIDYQESQEEKKLKIKMRKDEKEIYSSEIASKKDAKDKVAPYSIRIAYEDNYSEERLSITYRQQLKNYIQEHTKSKEDMSNRVPLKWLNILPETMMGGVLGFTYLGENFMGRRADLTGSTARMVDIHESIHTPDEYETRVLTSWIMEKIKPKYVR